MLHLEMDYEESIIDFPINRQRSSIDGMILADDPDRVYWSIDIESQEVLIPYTQEERDEFGIEEEGYSESCRLEISNLEFPIVNWRNLEGVEWNVTYESNEVHPILPDNPGTFFFAGQHHVPNNNRIAFGIREGRRFRVGWSCVAEGYSGEKGTRIVVNTQIALQRIGIYFANTESVSIKRAKELILLIADSSDIGPPSEERSQWVYFPLLTDA